MKSILASWLVLIVFLYGSDVLGHVDHSKALPKEDGAVGVEEKLGQAVPLDLVFRDEDGSPVTLRQLIHGPTILALVYYGCPNVCSMLLQNLAGTLKQMPAEPEKEYQVLAVSFDETETPELARERKRVYLQMLEKPFPEKAWRFLTGDAGNIRGLTGAVGFRFKREGKDFLHPVTLIALAHDGKIIRYLYGMEFLPFDVRMALLEASEGRVGPTVSKVLRFCFAYDPKGRKYVFNTLKVTGIVTIAFALSFVSFLIYWKKRRSPGEG